MPLAAYKAKEMNTTHISNFNNRCKGIRSNQANVSLSIEDARALQAELLDVLLYVQQLEERLAKKQADEDKTVAVVAHGRRF